MGSSYSAQAAYLHSLWGGGLYKGRHKFHSVEELYISDEGFPYWVYDQRPYQRTIASCQFRHNILKATRFPDNAEVRVVDTVCCILESCWGLAVLCDCREQHSDPCKHTNHRCSCVALGYCLIRGERGGGIVFVQPCA